LLCARLRPTNQDAAAGAVDEVERIVRQLRARWPEVKIVLLVPTPKHKTQIKCAKNIVRYPARKTRLPAY
jgi:flagellin-specific chaperone FliS